MWGGQARLAQREGEKEGGRGREGRREREIIFPKSEGVMKNWRPAERERHLEISLLWDVRPQNARRP